MPHCVDGGEIEFFEEGLGLGVSASSLLPWTAHGCAASGTVHAVCQCCKRRNTRSACALMHDRPIGMQCTIASRSVPLLVCISKAALAASPAGWQ